MSHLSATVPPLNLRQQHEHSAHGFYSFLNPASPHPDARGGPGILIESLTDPVTRHGLVATSISSPSGLKNTSMGLSAPPQPGGGHRTDVHLRLTTPGPTGVTQARESPPRTPLPHPDLAARQQAQQAAPRFSSLLRQSHQYVPYSPQDVGSPSPNRPRPNGARGREQLSRIPTSDITQRSANARPTTSRQTHQALSDRHEEAQGTPGEPRLPRFETHVVRFREPDLAGLIVSGVIKVNPESHPPEWMLKYAPQFSSHKTDVEVLENLERRTVELRHSFDSIRRNRSHKAQVERVEGGGVRRYFSNDSGYCTASSGLAPIFTAGIMSGNHEEGSPPSNQPLLLPSWGPGSSTSSEGERRTLRRRSSVPELGSRFRVER
ncbi:hypothetical protein N0V82_010596 [Gnomoniopsis sp. IMI 355080]|nr:hypothetical protein N0V82_010596 [Gnomoniopsis sp. IMI 355080]